jgi:hypothetical protein
LARLGHAKAAERFAKMRAAAPREEADVDARIEAILKSPKLTETDRQTSGKATLGWKD